MQKVQKKCCWNKRRPPWEPWLHFCGSQDVRTWSLCVYPGPPFPCHRAGQETRQPQPGAFTAYPLTQETPVAAQQGEVANFKEEETDTCSFAWNHRFYRKRRGETEGSLPALFLCSCHQQLGHRRLGESGTAGLSPEQSPASHQPFHNFLPQFHAVVWLLSMPFSRREPKMNCKGASAYRFVCWLFFFLLAKPWWLFYKRPSDTYLCLRRLRNFCLSEMMSSVYPQPLYSESNCNQTPSCYPAFSTALTWQCHPL